MSSYKENKIFLQLYMSPAQKAKDCSSFPGNCTASFHFSVVMWGTSEEPPSTNFKDTTCHQAHKKQQESPWCSRHKMGTLSPKESGATHTTDHGNCASYWQVVVKSPRGRQARGSWAVLVQLCGCTTHHIQEQSPQCVFMFYTAKWAKPALSPHHPAPQHLQPPQHWGCWSNLKVMKKIRERAYGNGRGACMHRHTQHTNTDASADTFRTLEMTDSPKSWRTMLNFKIIINRCPSHGNLLHINGCRQWITCLIRQLLHSHLTSRAHRREQQSQQQRLMHSSFCLISTARSSPGSAHSWMPNAATEIWAKCNLRKRVHFYTYGHAQLLLAAPFPLVRAACVGTEITHSILHVLTYLLTEVNHKEGNCKCHSNKSSNFRQRTWCTCLGVREVGTWSFGDRCISAYDHFSSFTGFEFIIRKRKVNITIYQVLPFKRPP